MGDPVRVLDLFSGLNGWSAPWKDAGHAVFTIDNDPKFNADSRVDIGNVEAVVRTIPWQRPHVILASPPCTSFSTMSMGHHWTHDGCPKTETARQGERLVLATMHIIMRLRPKAFVIENPRARLRTLGLLDGLERTTVTYCQYGEDRMKPTDLWYGGFDLDVRPMCKNGDPCHQRAPRGSRNGTQGGVDTARAGLIPYQLADEVRVQIEDEWWRT